MEYSVMLASTQRRGRPTASQTRRSGGRGVPVAVRCIMYEESTGQENWTRNR
ncbi:hypothetical protein BDV25DRAFT_146778 [Aspergillus avenaceus]|uniref:Uncharacterized protein n=1 Tax=Aspergillus avenaceus TaxID=36643 RepID=A0A5N6U8M1_ASPAV|nr:hypothetical protein BDV25DRAFT_146778 [Aspergillus avenaceus]